MAKQKFRFFLTKFRKSLSKGRETNKSGVARDPFCWEDRIHPAAVRPVVKLTSVRGNWERNSFGGGWGWVFLPKEGLELFKRGDLGRR